MKAFVALTHACKTRSRTLGVGGVPQYIRSVSSSSSTASNTVDANVGIPLSKPVSVPIDIHVAVPVKEKDVSNVNLVGLKTETSRVIYRAFKKVDKACERLLSAQTTLDTLAMTTEELNTTSSSTNDVANANAMAAMAIWKQEEVVAALTSEVEGHKHYLQSLQTFNDQLSTVKNTKSPLLAALLKTAAALGLKDAAPIRPDPKPKKVKQRQGVVNEPRLPYKVYISHDGLEIRVGRGAEDNDLLSCDKRYRHNNDWWMHVSGSPGSHIVICYQKDDLLTAYPETMKDAAALAAFHSKSKDAGRVNVTITRARCIYKPKDCWQAGMVRLNGSGADMSVANVNVKMESARLNRLETDRSNSLLDAIGTTR